MIKRISSLCSFLLISACCDVGKVPDPPGVQKAIAALGDHQVPPPPPASLSKDPACKLLCWPLTPDRARQILERTKMFATTGVSIGGEPTPQVAAFNALLQQPDRESRFVTLSRNRNVVARLYALCGLEALGMSEAKSLAVQLRAVGGTVVVLDGCMESEETISEAVDFVNSRSFGRAFVQARSRTFEYFSKLADGKVDWKGVCGELGRYECPSQATR